MPPEGHTPQSPRPPDAAQGPVRYGSVVAADADVAEVSDRADAADSAGSATTGGEWRRADAGFELSPGVLGALFALFIVSLGAVWFGAGAVARFALRNAPLSWDEQLGRLGAVQIDTQFTKLDDDVVTADLQRVADYVAEHAATRDASAPKVRLTVLKGETVNAFALPGGNVYVVCGLLKQAETSDEVAGVLAHEIGHVVNRHSMQQMARGLATTSGVPLVLALFGFDTGLIATLATHAANFAAMSHTRESENEADGTAYDVMRLAGYNPESLAKFFERLSVDDVESTEGVLHTAIQVLQYGGSHPAAHQRAAIIRFGVAHDKPPPSRVGKAPPVTFDLERAKAACGAQ
jgi:beta-barrel assembly-enhancing protease